MNKSKLKHIGIQFFADDPAPADPAPAEPAPADPAPTPDESTAEIKRLQAELAKQKAATDKASKEAADFKKQLRASQSAEEQRAEEERERQAAIEAELNQLRKDAFVSKTAKRVFAFAGDEAAATSIAEALYGAADTDAAIDALSKVWGAKEKQLRAEFGKIPAPGSGGNDAPAVTRDQLSAMNYMQRLEFATKYPEQYQKLMN